MKRVGTKRAKALPNSSKGIPTDAKAGEKHV